MTDPLTAEEKKTLRAQLRDLRSALRVWTLKEPGLHIDQAIVCSAHQGRLLDGKPVLCEDGKRGICEGCLSTLNRTDRADGIRAEIRTLTDRLKGRTPEPQSAPLRKATIFTGRGEQLVMFV